MEMNVMTDMRNKVAERLEKMLDLVDRSNKLAMMENPSRMEFEACKHHILHHILYSIFDCDDLIVLVGE